MTKQVINVGTADKGNGDPLRTAFIKVNSNFDELYAALGADLTSLASHIIPETDDTYDLGSATHKWRSLYVSSNTIYIDNIPLSVVDGVLKLDSQTVGGTPAWSDITGKPAIPSTLDSLTDVFITGASSGQVLKYDGANWINVSLTEDSLGNLRVNSSAGGTTIGTVDNPNTGGWGGYDLYIDSGNNSNAKIYIPSVSHQAANMPLQILNNALATSIIQLFGRGGVQVVTNNGVNEKVFEFADNGTLIFPDGSLALTNSVLNNGLDADLKGSVFADDSTLLVDGVNGTIPYAVLSGTPAIPADVSDLTDTQGLLSTGNITFDGVKIQGAGTASGDGNGYATIELVPDTNLYANDQYLIIDPTAPSHIHIRAGGTQDASNTELYLGGENSYFRVGAGSTPSLEIKATDNSVLVRTQGTVVTNNIYTNTTDFVTDIDPSLGFVISGWNQRNETEIELNLFVPGLESFYTFLTSLGLGSDVVVTYSTVGGNQTFTSTVSQVFSAIAQFDPVTGWQRTTGRILGTLPVDQTGIVSINFPVTTTPQRDWTFSDTGSLTFPDATVQTTAYTGTANLATVARNIESEGDVSIRVNLTDSTTRIWRFGEDGDLTAPGAIDSNNGAGYRTIIDPDSITAIWNGTTIFTIDKGPSGGSINAQAGKSFQITTDNQSAFWTFGTDGNLTLPGELHGAPVMSVGPTPSQVGRTVNITPADDASDKKFRFRVDQYAGQTFTRAYLELPTAEVDKQVAAVFPHANGTAAYIYTQGADSYDDGLNNAFNIFYNAGDIKLTAMTPVTGTFNTWKFGSNGDLTLPGNLQSEGGINIDINLSDSTLRRWQFGEDGDLTFPDATVQTTAFTGNAATVDITNTNGIDTNYSITFVENRDGAEILRADVDLTFNSWSNTLTTGNVEVKQTITGGILESGSDFFITSQPNPDRNNACNIGIYPGGATGTASQSGFVLIQGGVSDVVGLAAGDVYLRGGVHTNGGVGGTIKVESVLKIDDGVHEKFQTKSNATGTVTHDCASGHIFYHTLPSANWTVNLTNLNLAVGYATTVTLVIEQSATGYYPNAIQIDGNGVGLAWQGNTTPTPSSSRIDVVTFSILYDGLYTVLGQLTGF